MWHPKLRDYLYEIVECFPAPECELGVRVLTTHDRLEDAEKVMAVLESVNYNFTCYSIMLRPVWDDKTPSITATGDIGWDANGSPVAECDHSGSSAWISTSGESGFHCPKCGKSTRTDPFL